MGFEQCCECFNEYVNRPFGGLVFVSLWLAAIEAYCCVVALGNRDELAQCEFPSGWPRKIGIQKWLYIQAVFAITNFAFAPYLQNHLWQRLMGEAKERDNLRDAISDRTKEAQAQGGAIRLSQHDLIEAFKAKSIMAYSVLVLCAFTWSLFGWLWILRMGPWALPEGHARLEDEHATDCNPGAFGDSFGAPAWAARTGMFFLVFFVTFMTAWIINIMLMEPTETLTLQKRQADYQVVPENEEQKQEGGWFSNWGSPPTPTSPTSPTTPQEPKPPSRGRQAGKLVASLGVDFLGMSSYALPGVGEVGDVVFAPASSVALKMMYNANGIAAVGLIEEILPGTDVVPTATIAWTLETFFPNSRLTKGFGINPMSWAMTGHSQR